VSLLHVTAGLESAHVAEGYLRRDACRSPRRAPARVLRIWRQARVTCGVARAALLRLDGGMSRPGGGSWVEGRHPRRVSICGGTMFQDVRETLQQARFDLCSSVPALAPTAVLRAHLTGIRGSCSCERRAAVNLSSC
jgi:hypothetical protein